MEYTEQERNVFAFVAPDGTPRFADPLLKYRQLVALFEGDLDRVVREYGGEDANLRWQATQQIAWAVCEAFGLPHFDEATGEGTLAEFCLALLRDFLLWREGQKKSGVTPSGSPSPGSPGSSPNPPPTPSTAA